MPSHISCSRILRVAFPLTAVLLLSGQPPSQGQQSVGVNCQVDASSSRVYARVDAASRLGHVHGVEGRLASGTISLTAGGELVFDMTSFQADTAQARQYVGLDAKVPSEAHKVTSNMLGADVLDVSRYPRAVYSITSIRPVDGQAAGQPGRYQFEVWALDAEGHEQPMPDPNELSGSARRESVSFLVS